MMNEAVDLCPNIENCTLQKDIGKWENPNILAAIFLFPQVEQKGRDIHICGRGYLIWSLKNQPRTMFHSFGSCSTGSNP